MTSRSPVPPLPNSRAGAQRSARDRSSVIGGESSDWWRALALASAAAKNPASALDHALALLGPLYRADRAWVGRYNAALTHFWAAHEWVRHGIVSHFDEVQAVPVEMMLDAHGKFLRGEIVAIPDVEQLPRQSRALQAELRREGNRSTLCAPLTHGGELIGFFGFDYVRGLAAWTLAEMTQFRDISEYLAALLHRTLAANTPSELPVAPQEAIYITESGGRRALVLADIACIEANGDYSRVHRADGRDHLELRSLRAWSAQLPRGQFLRVHQSYLVNATRIDRLTRGPRWTLHLQGHPDPIPVGRAFRPALRLRMGF